MNQDQNDTAPTPVENGQQSDSAPHDVAISLLQCNFRSSWPKTSGRRAIRPNR